MYLTRGRIGAKAIYLYDRERVRVSGRVSASGSGRVSVRVNSE
jgi:hypothetical protein